MLFASSLHFLLRSMEQYIMEQEVEEKSAD